MPSTRRKRSSSTTMDSAMSGHGWLEIEFEGGQHPRVHIVSADEHGELDDLPRIEMGLYRCKYLIRHRDGACHRIGIGERCAFGGTEQLSCPPVGERIALFAGKPVRERQRGHMLAQYVLRSGEITDADDDDLPQAAGESRLPAHGVRMIE